jgi:hypothetical protein
MKRQILKAFAGVAALGLSLGLAQHTATARPVGGDITHFDHVLAHSVDTYQVACWGGEVTRIDVCGDGDTDLDLYVYDEYGNLIASDRQRQGGPGAQAQHALGQDRGDQPLHP